jgi:hypothetical protein
LVTQILDVFTLLKVHDLILDPPRLKKAVARPPFLFYNTIYSRLNKTTTRRLTWVQLHFRDQSKLVL